MYILNSILVHYSVALRNYCEELAWHDETKNGRAERHWISSTPPELSFTQFTCLTLGSSDLESHFESCGTCGLG